MKSFEDDIQRIELIIAPMGSGPFDALFREILCLKRLPNLLKKAILILNYIMFPNNLKQKKQKGSTM